jgi:SAM-dependent methyltransferase
VSGHSRTPLVDAARRTAKGWTRRLQSWLSPAARGRIPEDDYERRARQEVQRFAGDFDVHALPPIFHYWSNRYLRPLLESFGASHPDDFFARQIAALAARDARRLRIVSIGAGNGDTEVRVARLLRERGIEAFHIECLDINPVMLARGAELASAEGVVDHVGFVQGDFNRWRPNGRYDVVMANQSLHHVVELESLFDTIHGALDDDGAFIVSDMIGRNGHQRWPEALAVVQEFWQELPPQRRRNLQLDRDEPEFLDWDCAVEGFEGIRAQDILPMLIARFGFELFIAYGNVVDPFVDRSFGHHFDADSEADRAFIDRVHARDEAAILAGQIKPTHMMAVMRRDRAITPRVWRHLTPAFCVRDPRLP